MNLFLRAKHWHIFIVIFALPQIMQVVWMNLIFSNVAEMQQRVEQDPEAFMADFFSMMPWFMLVVALISFVQFGWYVSVALGLRKYTPEAVRLKTTPFWIALVPVVLITLGIFAVMTYVFQDMEMMASWARPQYILPFMGVAFISAFSMLYLLYYTGKAYKTALLKRKVQREEVVGEFFMTWFLFVGIWMMQPKINEMIQGEENPPLASEDLTDFKTYSN